MRGLSPSVEEICVRVPSCRPGCWPYEHGLIRAPQSWAYPPETDHTGSSNEGLHPAVECPNS